MTKITIVSASILFSLVACAELVDEPFSDDLLGTVPGDNGGTSTGGTSPVSQPMTPAPITGTGASDMGVGTADETAGETAGDDTAGDDTAGDDTADETAGETADETAGETADETAGETGDETGSGCSPCKEWSEYNYQTPDNKPSIGDCVSYMGTNYTLDSGNTNLECGPAGAARPSYCDGSSTDNKFSVCE